MQNDGGCPPESDDRFAREKIAIEIDQNGDDL